MDLGVATHFAQGWEHDLIPAIEQVEAGHARDAIYWSQVERVPGVYLFDRRSTEYPARLIADGTDMVMLFRATHPDVENGHTVQSGPALSAFAEFVAATVAAYPEVDTVEIGNEFNGTFVVGPLEKEGPVVRAKAHARIVAAVAERLRQTAPEVTILGGAAHSIPLVYLEALGEAGLMDDIDGLVVHPYTSPPEHVGEHLRIALQALGRPDLAIHATEFGQERTTPRAAADYLVRMATAMAAAGVDSATWYALIEQRKYPGMGLLNADGTERPAGAAFRLMQRLLALGTPKRIDLGPGLRAYDFAGRGLVVWGLERTVTAPAGLDWTDATGAPQAAPTLSPEAPLIAFSPTPIRFEDMVSAEDRGIIDDSYYGFTLAPGTPWRRMAQALSGKTVELTMQGGGRRGTAWRPYLGDRWLNPLSVSERVVIPAVFPKETGPVVYEVVEEIDLVATGTETLCAAFRHDGDRGDGVDLTLSLDGVEIEQAGLQPGETLSWRVTTGEAQRATLTVSPREGAGGDRIFRHHVLLDGGGHPCPAPMMPD
ncbi:MAG: hypothetical protein AAF899_01785 [Pseudomonadota bacterium]